jgi:hypothetical protein
VVNPSVWEVNELVKIVSEGIYDLDVIAWYKESHVIAHVHHYITLPPFHAPIDSVYLAITSAMSKVDIGIPLQFEVMGTIQRYIVIVIYRYAYGVIRFMRVCLNGGNGSSHFSWPTACGKVVMYFHAFGSVYTKVAKTFGIVHLQPTL